jgi:hypothetical protein
MNYISHSNQESTFTLKRISRKQGRSQKVFWTGAKPLRHELQIY